MAREIDFQPSKDCTNTTRYRLCAIPSWATAALSDIANYIVRGPVWDAFDSTPDPCCCSTRWTRRHRVSERSAAGTGSHGIYVYETPKAGEGETPGRSHHLPATTKRTAGCFSAPRFFPLHQISRSSRRCQRIVDVHFPNLKKSLLRGGARSVLQIREVAGAEEKASTSELLDG